MRPVSRVAMAAALTLSAASMLAHNLYEMPLYSRVVAAVALGWGVLNLVIGGIVTVLPLAILPFAPEQSVTHYGAHVVYAVGQVPLVVLGYRALRRPATAGDPIRLPPLVP